jgi:hypothetical protein
MKVAKVVKVAQGCARVVCREKTHVATNYSFRSPHERCEFERKEGEGCGAAQRSRRVSVPVHVRTERMAPRKVLVSR